MSLLVECPGGKSGNYVVPAGVKSVGDYAFATCRRITNLFLADSVTNLGYWSFSQCDNIKRITIPRSLQQIGPGAFQSCAMLAEFYFQGNAPAFSGYDTRVFPSSSVNIYYLPGTTGWDAFFNSINFVGILWNPKLRLNKLNGGTGTNRLSVDLTGTADIPFVLEATTNWFASPWLSIQSGTLTGGSVTLTNMPSPNSAQYFYRVRSP
jgi:hypothetical protein